MFSLLFLGHTSHIPLVRTHFSRWVKAPHYIPVSNLHSINVSCRQNVTYFWKQYFGSFTRACLNEFPCDKSIKRWSMEIFLWALVIKGVIFLKRWDAPSVKTFLTTYTTWLFNNQISTASRPSSRPPWFVCSVHKYCIKWNATVYDIKDIERFSIKCQYLPETLKLNSVLLI